MQDVDAMVAEMQAAAGEGVSAIVDGGHDDMGRSVAFLREVSERSGMPIVVSGGYYLDAFHPPELADRTEDEIAAALAEAATAERWGAFGEIASSDEMTPGERKVFGAIGRAHLLTNVPIFTHTANGLEAETQLDIFESLGVPPGNVANRPHGRARRSGGDGSPAPRGARRLRRIRPARRRPEADGHKVPMIRALIDAGYLENVLLASDFARASDIQRNGGPGYAKTVTQFVPMLREAGVTDEQIHAMTVDNPLRLLAFVPPSA